MFTADSLSFISAEHSCLNRSWNLGQLFGISCISFSMRTFYWSGCLLLLLLLLIGLTFCATVAN